MRVGCFIISITLLSSMAGCAYQPNQAPQQAYEALEQTSTAKPNPQPSNDDIPEAVAAYLAQPIQVSPTLIIWWKNNALCCKRKPWMHASSFTA